jgi:flagellar basal body P-ring formation protein FlgA
MSLALLIAAAAAFADLDTIDRQIAQFTGAAIGAEGGAVLPLDRRLRLRPCTATLALAWRGERRDTVTAACPDPGGWRLFVPIKAGASPLSAAPIVNRGDAVTIAVSGQGFSVSQPGEALEAGAVGAWVRVRAANGKAAPMHAQVVRPGLVTLPMP